MADSLANDIIGAENHLRSERSDFEAMWREVAAQNDPLSPFNGTGDTGVANRGRLAKQFNSRPSLTLQRAASAATSLLVPPGSKWHGLKPVDEELVDNQEATNYCESMRRLLFSWRYDPKANFQGALGPAYRELMNYGTPCVHIEERFGGDAPFLYRFVPLSQVVFSVDETGVEDTVYRTFAMTAKQMAQKFGENKLSQAAKTALDDPKLRGEKHFTVIHAVYPKTSDKSRFAYDSVYIDVDGKKVMQEGGTYEMPYLMSSFGRVDDHLPYGYAPGLLALAAIKGAHHAKRLFLRAAEKAVDPVMGVSDEHEGTININAGSLVRGAFNRQGRQMIGPIAMGGNPNLGNDTFEMFSADIDACYGMDLFAAVMNKPDMTATEVLSIMEERNNFLSPTFENQEAMLGRCIAREISIVNRKAENGEIELPPMPDVLRDGDGIDLEFTSPLAQLRKAKQAQANMQAGRAVGELAQFNPAVSDTVDWDELAYQAGDAFGASPTIWADKKVVAETREARAQQAAQQQQLDQQTQQTEQVRNIAPAVKMMEEGA